MGWRMRSVIPTAMGPGSAWAAPVAEKSKATLVTGEYLLQVLASLGLVIGLLLLVLWLLRRFNGIGQGAGVGSPLRVIASVGLGQRERAVLLAAGDQQILIGVAPGHIATLHVFDEPVVEVSSTKPAAPLSFGDVWRATARGEAGKS